MKRHIKSILSSTILGVTLLTGLTGCGSSLEKEMTTAMDNNQEIKLSVDGASSIDKRKGITWVELDQLTTFKNIRKVWDDNLQIITFDTGSKNGVIYVDLNGNWAGNNVLYNAFQNKTFVKDFWSNNKLKSNLSQVAMEEFSDITNESTGIIASINAYYNIMPTNEDGTSGLMEGLTRAEVMSAIYRGDTPVIYGEVNADFEKAVGKNDFNMYAYEVNENSYLKFDNGSLNYDSYNSLMTRAEAIYILMNRYFPEELEATEAKGELSDCKNAGNVAEKLGFTGKHAWQSYELEYCLQNSADGAPESLYKALVLANRLGIISSQTRWNEGIIGGELLDFMVRTYQAVQNKNDFAVNAKTGENVGESLYIAWQEPEVEPEKTESSIGEAQVEQIRDVTNLDDLMNIYGDEVEMTDEELAEAYEVAENYTFEPCDKWMQVDYCYFLNVRTGPSTDFRILRSVPSGTKAHIVARCVETGWYRIITEGKIVYQCGVYFSDFEGSENYNMRTGDNANDNTIFKRKDESEKPETSSEIGTDFSIEEVDGETVEDATEEVDGSEESSEESSEEIETETVEKEEKSLDDLKKSSK